MDKQKKELVIMYHEIHRLREAEHFSIQRIADHFKINFRTAKKLLEMRAEQFDAYLERRDKRGLLLAPYREFIVNYLQRYADTPSAVIHDRLKEQFAGFPAVDPKTVYNYVMLLRKEHSIPRITGSERQYSAVPDVSPGEQAQVDFGEKKLRTGTGDWTKVYFFIMLLCFSRQKFIWFRDKPFTAESAVQAHEKAFEFFKGIPREIIYDQDSVFLHSENRGDYRMTDIFGRYQASRPFKVVFCRAADPESKGKVENTVKYTKQNFLFHRAYISTSILNEQVIAWLNRTGNAMVHNTTRKIPQEQWCLEQPFLHPWHALFPVAKENGYKVLKTNTIKYRGNSYSLPFGTYKNDSTRVYLTESENLLYIKDESGALITTHLIPAGVGNNVVNNNHRRNTAIKLDQLRSTVREFFLHSPQIDLFMGKIDLLYPRYVRDQLSLILTQAEKHGTERSEIALEFCIRNSLFSANDFKAILENQTREKKPAFIQPQIKPLGDAKTQLMVNIQPEKSDINHYEALFSQILSL